MVEEVIEFLTSFKNAESLSPRLRKELSVPTNLESVVESAARNRRIVFISGAAGSGKTHLLRGLDNLVAPVVREGEKARGPHVLVVEDATELSAKERVEVVRSRSRSREATIMAINEGEQWVVGSDPVCDVVLEGPV